MPHVTAHSTGSSSALPIILVVALLIAAPLVALFVVSIAPSDAASPFASPVGWAYVRGTLALGFGAGFVACVLGVAAAMLVTMTEFPGRRIFEIALVLPFAVPAYILAYVFADWFSPFGPVASVIGVDQLPPIRSLPGAIVVMALATYPYVYLTTRASLAGRAGAYFEAARSLGATPFAACRRIALGMNRPAIFGGLALALMEIAADYGVAEHFGVRTLSVGIFRQWHGAGDLAGATQLALSLFAISTLFILLEKASRRGRTSTAPRSERKPLRLRLNAMNQTLAIGFLTSLVLFGFALPAISLIAKAIDTSAIGATRGLQSAFINTGIVAFAGAFIASALAAILAFMLRQTKSTIATISVRIATLGYAAPGAVIAIGILTLIAPLGASIGLTILVYAYVVRFLTAGYNATESGFANVSPQIDAAARSLGATPGQILTRLHLPMTQNAILAGGAIIALDIAKELPATLLLRPFNFETLATHVYRLASDERLADASPAALTLLFFGTLIALALAFTSRK